MKQNTRRQYGLIGFPLSHSFSPGYFKRKFKKEGIQNAAYDLYPLSAIEQFDDLPDALLGLNVTIPYKEAVMPYLDRISEEAAEIGAVNTIDFRDGRKIGYNTDVFGFERSLLSLIEDRRLNGALVLGTGGAAKAVIFVLRKLSIPITLVSRSSGDLTYSEINEKTVASHHLIVNTTPLGMHPHVDRCPDLPYGEINDHHILYDLIYNPEKTLFLRRGEERRARIKNGLEMLQLQAERSWEIWNLRD